MVVSQFTLLLTCSMVLLELFEEHQAKVYLVDAQVSPILQSNETSLLDVIPWLEQIDYDSCKVIIFPYNKK